MTTLPLLKEVLSPAVVRALGYALLHSLWQGGVLALVLAGLLPLLRRRRAELRYAVAVAALAGLVLAVGGTFGYYYHAAPSAGVARPVAAVPAPQLAPAVALAVSTPVKARPATWLQAAGRQCEPYLPLLVGAWLLGTLLMGGRLLGGLLYAGRLRRVGTHALGADWQQRLTALAGRAGLRRPVALLESARVAGPLVLGHLRPVILLPLGAVAGLSPALLEALLAHEVAHIARRDYLLNLGLAVAEVVFFYHPAVWFMAACLRTERENCCDDQATVLCGGDRLRVARALAALAELEAAAPMPHLALAAAGVGGRGSLLARVRRLALGRPKAPTLAEGVLAGLLTVLGLLGLGTGVVLAATPGHPASATRVLAPAHAVPADTVRRPAKKAAASVPVPPVAPPAAPTPPAAPPVVDVALDSAGWHRDVQVQLDSEPTLRRRYRTGQQPETVVVEKDKKGRLTKLTVNGQEVDVPGKKARKGKGTSTTTVIEVPPPATAEQPDWHFRFETPGQLEELKQLKDLSVIIENPGMQPDGRTLRDAQRNLERALRSPGLNTEQYQRMQRDLQRMQADLQQQSQQFQKLRLQQSPSGTFRLHLDRQTDADARQAAADARQAVADARQAQADALQAEADARQAESDAREAGREDARASTEARTRRAELRARIAAAQAELRALERTKSLSPLARVPAPPRVPQLPRPLPRAQVPILPAPPAPPSQHEIRLREALRNDGLIKDEKHFSFELNDAGGRVDGKELTAAQVAKYRRLLNLPTNKIKGSISTFSIRVDEN